MKTEKQLLSPCKIEQNNFLLILINWALIILITVCVFDPANKFLGLKYIIFSLVWSLFLIYRLSKRNEIFISSKLLGYIIIFVFIIPFFSLVYYSFLNGDFNRFDGFQYFSSYLFLLILIILYSLKLDLTKAAIVIFSILSFITLIIFFLYYNSWSIVYGILALTEYNDITTSGIRTFGGVDFLSVNFQSSPLIALPIAYFSMKLHNSIGLKKIGTILLLIINMAAMFLGGTRSNMIISILLPLFVLVWYSKRKKSALIIVIVGLSLLISFNLNIIQGFFSAEEKSNSVKLDFYNDYLELFNHWDILLFGQGLGSYFNSNLRGYVSVSELTYFEFIRRFGLILSLFIFGMLLYPVLKLRNKNNHNHYIFISYGFYLVICFANPFLMSSTGMLFLTLVLYKTFVNNNNDRIYKLKIN